MKKSKVKKLKIISIFIISILVLQLLIPVIGTINISNISNADDTIIATEGDGYNDITNVNGIIYRNYKQYLGTYASNPYFGGTMADSGCGPTAAAIMLSGYGIDKSPWDVAKIIKEEYGDTTSSTTLVSALNDLDFSATRYSINGKNDQTAITNIEKALEEGKPVMMAGLFTSAGHWICLVGIKNEKVIISDPGNVSVLSGKSGNITVEDLINNWAYGGSYIIPEETPIFVGNDEDYEYETLDDGTIEITKYNGKETDLIIPGMIDGKKVTSIGDSAFSGCSNLLSIIIPSSVTNIAKGAFYGSKLYVVSDNNEVELPEIIKKVKKEGNILYSDKDFKLKNCTINSENSKVIVDDNIEENDEVSLYIQSGSFLGLTVNVVKPGTIIYSKSLENWTNENIKATLIIEEGDKITNNDEKNSFIFEENGDFIFEYTTATGEKKTAKAQVKNIDKEVPEINSVTGNATEWTNKDITLTINAEDKLSGLAEKPYSFDGGQTWQADNTKTYSQNTTGIVIKVKDIVGNIAIYETINIAKIDKEVPEINSVTGNATEWTDEDVTLTINAEDKLSGLAEKPYSFDGGQTWQADNTKTYSQNTTGIVIKVKDIVGNIATYETINITKIDRDGPVVSIKTEKVEADNKLKIKIISNEAIKNLNDFDLWGNLKIESWQLSEDEKELSIIYVNNTEEDMKLTDIFIVKDELGNMSIVYLEELNIIIPVNGNKIGDINADGKVNVTDLLLLKRHLIAGTKETWKLTEDKLKRADINEDEKVNVTDLILLKRIIISNNA